MVRASSGKKRTRARSRDKAPSLAHELQALAITSARIEKAIAAATRGLLKLDEYGLPTLTERAHTGRIARALARTLDDVDAVTAALEVLHDAPSLERVPPYLAYEAARLARFFEYVANAGKCPTSIIDRARQGVDLVRGIDRRQLPPYLATLVDVLRDWHEHAPRLLRDPDAIVVHLILQEVTDRVGPDTPAPIRDAYFNWHFHPDQTAKMRALAERATTVDEQEAWTKLMERNAADVLSERARERHDAMIAQAVDALRDHEIVSGKPGGRGRQDRVSAERMAQLFAEAFVGPIDLRWRDMKRATKTGRRRNSARGSRSD